MSEIFKISGAVVGLFEINDKEAVQRVGYIDCQPGTPLYLNTDSKYWRDDHFATNGFAADGNWKDELIGHLPTKCNGRDWGHAISAVLNEDYDRLGSTWGSLQ
jgi:hypothetical protein